MQPAVMAPSHTRPSCKTVRKPASIWRSSPLVQIAVAFGSLTLETGRTEMSSDDNAQHAASSAKSLEHLMVAALAVVADHQRKIT